MGMLVVLLVSVFFLAVFGFCVRFLHLSWAFSLFTGRRVGVFVGLVVCLVVLFSYVAVMSLLLHH
ncbi:MAG TPA: hypothetical protein VEL31_02285 [Ktedonobacteraceae bacterium]|nr:hypothetical protein [Ktedonobacteraceae bacterium]